MVVSRVCQRCRRVVSGNCDCRAERKQNTTRDGYDRKWQRFRERLIRKRARLGELKCGMCERAFGSESPHADHIMPVQDQGDPLFFDENNIQFLHAECHAIKTQRDVKLGLTR